MIRMTYLPARPRGHLTLVGKGIMYDAGGMALKPADDVHATMKNDMSGAGAIMAAMAQLEALGCKTAVTGYLMCTDNRPSDNSIAMGDVLTVYGGKTVEVANTDAEGRLVMADALVLATEDETDAIVDIATLTGAAMRALGNQVAGLIGNNAALVAQVEAAADVSGESVWELPLERRYRGQLTPTSPTSRIWEGPMLAPSPLPSSSTSSLRKSPGPTSTLQAPPKTTGTPPGARRVAPGSVPGFSSSLLSTSNGRRPERSTQ